MNNAAIANILLALLWTAITGSFTPLNFTAGLVAGFVALSLVRSVPGVPGYSRRTWTILALAGFFFMDVWRANLRVTRDLVRGTRLHSAIIVLPTDARTDLERVLVVAFITVTPGSTVLEVARDGAMVVHLTNLPDGDVEAARSEIQNGIVRRVLEAVR